MAYLEGRTILATMTSQPDMRHRDIAATFAREMNAGTSQSLLARKMISRQLSETSTKHDMGSNG